MAKKHKPKQGGKPFVSYPGLLNDILFKIVFGSHQNKAILRALLNALLGLKGPYKIVDLEILSPSAEKIYLDDKGPVVDLKAQDSTGSRYNVELQLRKGLVDYIKRSLYYTTKLYCEQLKSGHDYDLLEKAISISILDFNLFPDNVELHSTFRLWEPKQNRALTNDLELHYIELQKFTPDKPAKLRTRFEKWLYVLKFADLYHSRNLPKDLAQEEGISMAIDAMRKAYARDDIRELIEAREKAERDEISRVAHALRKGRNEGIKEGRKEHLEEVARRMLSQGFTPEQVQMATGASQEQVELWLKPDDAG